MRGNALASRGLLGFLAQTLTRVESKNKAFLAGCGEEEDEDHDAGPGEIDVGDEHLRRLVPARTVELRECDSPQLRAAVDRLLQTNMRADLRDYAELLRECTKHKALLEGKQVHAHICKGGFGPDLNLSNRLIQMYGSCGSAAEARLVFDAMRLRTVHTWNMMITAYTQSGQMLEAEELFGIVREPSVVTWNAMASGYAQNGYLDRARAMFEATPDRNVVSWNAVIGAYAHAGHFSESLWLFKTMDLEGVEPNRVSFLHALNSCSSVSEGMAVHASLLEAGLQVVDVAVATGLIIMYGKCGQPEAAKSVFQQISGLDFVVWTALLVAYAHNAQTGPARAVFNRMPQRTVVTWTAMLAAYSQNGQCRSAWEMFKLMDQEGVRPNKITLITALDSCGSSGSLTNGRVVHGHVVAEGLDRDVPVCNALITMYSKCGDLAAANRVFARMPTRNVVTWSSMVAGYVHNGQNTAALDVFRALQLDGGCRPNGVTLLSVLNACCNAGWYRLGLTYFMTVPADYRIPLSAEHYSVAVDMLARAGFLQMAEDLLHQMPFYPDSSSWVALLRSCRIQKNDGGEQRAMQGLKQVEAEHKDED